MKLGAKNTDPLRPGGLPYNRDGDARGTIGIKPLNEINLCLSQDFFDKGDHISSNTVFYIKVFLNALRMRLVEIILPCPKRYLYW